MADYFVEGGDVLENKLGVTDSEQLQKIEENVFSDAALDVVNEDFSDSELNFDFLKSLHRRLFGKLYYFAGQIRTVNITKTDSSIPFCMADFIVPEASRIFGNLKSKNYLKELPREKFANELAGLAIELNALHPFREGNGRTIRLYLQLLACNAGYLIDYASLSHAEIVEADKQAFLGNDAKIKELYRRIVLPIDLRSAA
ncbi:MAG: Fic/DOC family protein [Ruthenibacterium lactatiformans]